jgi:hypothetical protein
MSPKIGWWLMELPCSTVFIYTFWWIGGPQSKQLVPRILATIFTAMVYLASPKSKKPLPTFVLLKCPSFLAAMVGEDLITSAFPRSKSPPPPVASEPASS